MASLLDRVGPTRTLLGLLGSLFLAGVGIGAASTSYRGLPGRLEAAEAAVDSLRQGVEDIREMISQSLCLSVAEKAKTPWQDCVSGLDTKK